LSGAGLCDCAARALCTDVASNTIIIAAAVNALTEPEKSFPDHFLNRNRHFKVYPLRELETERDAG
jgi:hypothetical protein